jgi:hypothetical protein
MHAAPILLVACLLAAGCALPFGPQAPPNYARELVAGAPFTQLVVEVDHAPGHRPSDAALAHLISTLQNVTSKTDVRLVVQEDLDGAARKWTADDLIALEKSTRSTAHVAPVAVLHVLYPAGSFDTPDVAGVTVTGGLLGPVTIFRDALASCHVAGPIVLPNTEDATAALERSTLLHEAGHAMGLVARGTPMVHAHEDKDHPGHSADKASVMYWSLDSCAGLRQALLNDGSVADKFDDEDRADLHAAGGR